MNKTYKSIVILVTLIVILFLYLINANLIIENLINYSELFLTTLFPVSFIFFIISSLLIDYGLIQFISKYLHLNTTKLYVFCLSLISGFPSGAKYSEELLHKDLIDISDANRIIMFSHFPNPLFVLGSVNLVIKNNSLCIKILVSIIISNFIIMLMSKKSSKIINSSKLCDNFSNCLSKAINSSFNTILLIYGTSLFFYLITVIVSKYVSFGVYSYTILNGIFDLTKGVFTTTLIDNITLRAYFILFFISFGSLSIHMQVKSIISKSDISYLAFIKGRVVSTIIAFIIFSILLKM